MRACSSTPWRNCSQARPHKNDGTYRFVPNDNRTAGGRLENGVLTLALEVRDARWYPDGASEPSLVMQMFAEAGLAPQNPGPMIRVPTGTKIHLSLRNALRDSSLVVYGLHTRPGATSDSIQIAPGRTRDVSFTSQWTNAPESIASCKAHSS